MFGHQPFGIHRRERRDSRISSGMRLYAIGDIHGRADLLRQIHTFILDDVSRTSTFRKVVVYLGDYIDRGRDSRGVIDLLLHEPLPGFERIQLKGNHDDCLIRFLADPGIGRRWLSHGGDRTLRSYGVLPPRSLAPREIQRTREELLQALPRSHIAFLDRLKPSHTEGDYFFVHAGIRPGTPLGRQVEADMLWIGHRFLNSRRDHGKVIVHGHTITLGPDVRENRIGVDTGAYETGRLTCLVLEGIQQFFLQALASDCFAPIIFCQHRGRPGVHGNHLRVRAGRLL